MVHQDFILIKSQRFSLTVLEFCWDVAACLWTFSPYWMSESRIEDVGGLWPQNQHYVNTLCLSTIFCLYPSLWIHSWWSQLLSRRKVFLHVFILDHTRLTLRDTYRPFNTCYMKFHISIDLMPLTYRLFPENFMWNGLKSKQELSCDLWTSSTKQIGSLHDRPRAVGRSTQVLGRCLMRYPWG